MEIIKGQLRRLGMIAVVAGVGFGSGMLGSAYQAEAAQTGTTNAFGKRIVVASGVSNVLLLTVPGLGELRGFCNGGGQGSAQINWENTTRAPIDAWVDYFVEGPTGRIVGPGQGLPVALFRSDLGEQFGTFVNLGQGNSPGPRRAATVQVNAYRGGPNAPCGFQAIATTWKS